MVHIFFLIVLFFTIPDINRKYPFIFFSFVSLFLFSALRYDFGNDYIEYQNIHYAIINGDNSWGQSDWLFKIINLWIKDFYVLIALLSALYIYALYNLVKKNLNTSQYWFSILILLINPYLFLVHQSSIRQTIAISIVILAINYAVNRSIIKYFILIIIAAGFHASAIVMFPIYFFLTDKKWSKEIVVIILLSVGLLLFTPAFDYIVHKALIFLPRHYLIYYEQGLQNSLRSTILSSVFFVFVLTNLNKLESRELIYGKLSLISTVISLLAFKVSMVTRIGMYFDIFLIISMPQIFGKIDNKLLKKLLFILFITIYLMRYYSFFANPTWANYYGKYRTILGL